MSDFKQPPPVHEFRPVHTEGRLLGPPPAELGLGRYKRIWQILISGMIIGVTALLLITGYFRAQAPARLADCMGRARILGNAFEMYRMDYGSRLPPAPVWRWAISEYVDMVGGATDGTEDIGRLARPRGFSSPMRCLANQTTIPISYFYLDPWELQFNYPDIADDSSIPVLVDEINHRSVVVLRADWSCKPESRETWANMRAHVYHIMRRPDWQRTFAYTVIPPQ